MSKAFGTKFLVINDGQQALNPAVFGGGPWLHLVSFVRGLKEYICFKHVPTDQIYIEELDPTNPSLFKMIDSQAEFEDAQAFLKERGYLEIGTNKEFKVAN
jgi:hypothetical protein